jgi:galactokinase
MIDISNALIRELSLNFKAQFGKSPALLVFAPGRINVIGEHIDYNDGYVCPAAIDKFMGFAIGPANGELSLITALDLNEEFQFDANDTFQPEKTHWTNYFKGVLSQFSTENIAPFQLCFKSTIPGGAGLSSSAALSCGFAYALNEWTKAGKTKKELALIGQRTEHEFAGVNCGLMDQFASVFGQKNHLLLMDCHDLSFSYVPADFEPYTFLLIDSKVKHSLADSAYNQRRREVEKAKERIKATFPGVHSFRDVNETQLEQVKAEIGDVSHKRASFVIEEIKRVKDAMKSIEDKRFEHLGSLLNQTHQGLSEMYEVSCAELDFLHDQALTCKGVLGARMMGGGFGGCLLILIHQDNVQSAVTQLSKQYLAKFGIEPAAYPVKIGQGIQHMNWHEQV